MTEEGNSTITDYLTGGFQYSNSFLQFFPHAEGYVTNVLTSTDCPTCRFKPFYSLNYVFNYTDHLGNVRVSYAQESGKLKILEENSYYPFGLKHTRNNVNSKMFVETNGTTSLQTIGELTPYTTYFKNNYKYNGKELQDELGLNMYDYGARLYDPARAGWSNIDPKAENSRRWSPYNYCYNNPIRFIDPDGMQAYDPGDKFKTMKAAALDFLKLYNGISIVNHVELNTALYKMKDGTYSYTVPEGRKEVNAKGKDIAADAGGIVTDVPKGTEKTGDAHTHGSDDTTIKGEHFNKLGPADSHTASEQAKASKNPSEYRMYIGTPNGSALEKDPYVIGIEPETNSKNPNIQTIATDITSDSKSDEPRLNKIDPGTHVPKIMPNIYINGELQKKETIKVKY